MAAFFDELAIDFYAFVVMARIWLIIGLGLRRDNADGSRRAQALRAFGTLFAIASPAIFLAGLVVNIAGAANRVAFKDRLERIPVPSSARGSARG